MGADQPDARRVQPDARAAAGRRAADDRVAGQVAGRGEGAARGRPAGAGAGHRDAGARCLAVRRRPQGQPDDRAGRPVRASERPGGKALRRRRGASEPPRPPGRAEGRGHAAADLDRRRPVRPLPGCHAPPPRPPRTPHRCLRRRYAIPWLGRGAGADRRRPPRRTGYRGRVGLQA